MTIQNCADDLRGVLAKRALREKAHNLPLAPALIDAPESPLCAAEPNEHIGELLQAAQVLDREELRRKSQPARYIEVDATKLIAGASFDVLTALPKHDLRNIESELRVRVLRKLLPLIKATTPTPDLHKAALRMLKNNWRIVLPWVLCSCAVALQMGIFSAVDLVPQLSKAMDPHKVLKLLLKATGKKR